MAKNNIKEYRAWKSMKARCYAPSSKGSHYDTNNIQVCDRWRNSYDNFIADMGNAPSASHSLDRIDNNGNYEPQNCRWATNTVQTRNRGSFNILVKYQNEDRVLKDVCTVLGLKYDTIHHRITQLGLSFEQAIADDPFDRKVTYKDKSQTMREWSEELNIPIRILYDRQFAGWETQRMMEQPIRRSTKKI